MAESNPTGSTILKNRSVTPSAALMEPLVISGMLKPCSFQGSAAVRRFTAFPLAVSTRFTLRGTEGLLHESMTLLPSALQVALCTPSWSPSGVVFPVFTLTA